MIVCYTITGERGELLYETQSPTNNSENEEEKDTRDTTTTTEDTPKEEKENLLMYVVLRVQKAYRYRNNQKLNTNTNIFPMSFTQPSLEHCFAVPRDRADQFYNFLLYWLPDVYGEDSSGFSTPCSNECEHFEEKAKVRKRWSDFSGTSSRSSLRSSICEDDVPELDEESTLLTRTQVNMLAPRLPHRTIGHRWELVYSTANHGISLRTLYRNFQYHDSPVLIVIRDESERVFGAFLSEPPRISDGFFGTGESLLFTFEDMGTEGKESLKTFEWTGRNTFFIKGSKNSLAIGDGDGVFGLWLDGDLNHGRTHTCNTFDNDLLTNTEDFICCALEAWAFV